MQNPLLAPELRKFISEKKFDLLLDFFHSVHPSDAAEYLSALEPEDIPEILNLLTAQLQAEIFVHLETDTQLAVTKLLSRESLAKLITAMPHDDRVDLLKRLGDERYESLMPALAQAEREDIRRLSEHPEGTAGSLMTSEYATLSPDLTAMEALAKLRLEAPDKETIYYAYVIDDQRRLKGFVSLKDLILAPLDRQISDIMVDEVISAHEADDQEDVARQIEKYDLIALPVVNDAGMLVGIITHDDAFDVLRQEQTEDMEKFMAISGKHEASAYLRTNAWEHFKNRAVWVVGLAMLGLVSGMIIHHFEASLLNLMILVLYMPMVASTGGNIGSQSATVVVRALALQEISPGDAFRVIGKELSVALLLALLLGGLTFVKVFYLSGSAPLPPTLTLQSIGVAVSVALSIQVLSATVVGALLPLAAAKLRLDPAVVASPALTTLVDITGLVIYFNTTRIILGI